MTGSDDDDASSTDDQDPLEEVLGEETLSGPDETESDVSGDDPPAESTPTDRRPSDPRAETDEAPTTADPHRGEQDQQRPPAVGSQGQPRPEPRGDESVAEWKLFVKDVVTSVLAVLILGGYLFAISGVWPPMVAIESESMEPNMNVDDLVFLMENERFAPSSAEAGVVTARAGTETGYETYGGSGDVIVFEPDGNGRTTPIIHRAMFWVDAGENWCRQADPQYLGSLSPSNDDCVADNAGFITKGDNNNRYDQAATQAENPVKPEWVVGTAEVRLPRLGWFRLQFQ